MRNELLLLEILQYHTNLAYAFQNSIHNVSLLHPRLNRVLEEHTTEIGIGGAFGNINLTSSNFCLLLQFSANDIHPAPESPSPCAMITVAVCFFTAGTTRAFAEDMFGVVNGSDAYGREQFRNQ